MEDIKIDITPYLSGKTIVDLPDSLDPIPIIKKQMRTCPFCQTDEHIITYNIYKQYKQADKEGKHHTIFTWLNKYEWVKDNHVKCTKCGTQWDTDWYPNSHEMFTIKI